METINKYKYGAALSGLLVFIVAFTFSTDKEKSIRAEHKTVFHKVEGLLTYRAIPTPSCTMEELNPFVFLNHHGPQVYPANNKGLPFGPHPHRGFETVTFIIDGDLKHRDNTGFESIISAGGVQWMTAGKGIIHAEESSERFLKEGGKVEILQLWINLPQNLKWTEPQYHGIPEEEIAHIALDNGKVMLNLISGEWEGVKGPHKSLTDVFMSSIDFKKEGSLQMKIPKEREVFFYVVKGKVNVAGRNIENLTLLEFNAEGEEINIKAVEDAIILIGHADIIEEPLYSKGPFVMNTKEEVKQAWKDYYDGKFGPFLPD